MTAREWKPGDRALIEVEVRGIERAYAEVRIVGPGTDEGLAYPSLDALCPVPAAGEAATEDVVERAARAFYIATQDDPEWAAMTWDDMGGSEPCDERAKIEIAMRAAFEDAGVVPGRGEAEIRAAGDAISHPAVRAFMAAMVPEIKAEALREAADAMRLAKDPGHWNLRDPFDADAAYSPDVWLEHRAARLVADGATDTEGSK